MTLCAILFADFRNSNQSFKICCRQILYIFEMHRQFFRYGFADISYAQRKQHTVEADVFRRFNALKKGSW